MPKKKKQTEEKKHYRKLECTAQMKQLVQREMALNRYARFYKPVAWLTSGSPVEIVRAMNCVVEYPENYGGICGAMKVADGLCEVAEGAGYNKDLCSYARNSLGSVLDPKKAPFGGLDRPDFLVTTNNICSTVTKWFEALGHHLNVPCFVIDTPFLDKDLEPHHIQYVKRQLEDLVENIGRVTGHKLRERELVRTLLRSKEAIELWTGIHDLGANKPSPLNIPDLFIHMAPIVSFRGTADCVMYYKVLKAELEKRVRDGIGAIDNERYRLIWDNIAIWYTLFPLFNQFSLRGAVFPYSTYTNAWSGDMNVDPNDPLEAVARVYTDIYLNRSTEWKARDLVNQVKKFHADGVVMHSNRSCKTFSLSQYRMRDMVSEKAGVPVLILEADMADSRNWSDAQSHDRVDAFLEILASRKGE